MVAGSRALGTVMGISCGLAEVGQRRHASYMGEASRSSEGQDTLPSLALAHYWGISQQMPPNQEGHLIWVLSP